MKFLNTHFSRIMLAACAAVLIPWTTQVAADEDGSIGDEDMAALRAERAEAQMKLAEAVRRVAEIQRRMGGEGTVTVLQEGVDLAEIERIRIRAREATARGLASMPPRLGVLLEPDDDNRARVIGLTPGSGAERAGIRAGDVIVSVNGSRIEGAPGPSIRQALDGINAGDTVEVVVQRNDGAEERALAVETSSVQRDVRLFVRRLSEDGDIQRELREWVGPDGAGRLPIAPLAPRLSGLGPDTDLISNHDGLKGYFGTGEGVLVLRVGEDNPMMLADGDVILTLDRAAVESPVDLARRLMQRESGDRVALEVMRNGTMIELQGAIPERRAPFGPTGRIHLPTPATAPLPLRPPVAFVH